MSTEEEYEGRPAIDYQEIHTPEDVYDLVEEGVIGTAEEYGFSCSEEMVDFILGNNFSEAGNNPVNEFRGLFDEHQDRELVVEEEEKGEVLDRKYSHAGGVWYNPENGDQWITNEEDLDNL